MTAPVGCAKETEAYAAGFRAGIEAAAKACLISLGDVKIYRTDGKECYEAIRKLGHEFTESAGR